MKKHARTIAVKALSIVFRGKYLDSFKTAYKKKELIFPGQIKKLGAGRGFNDLISRCYANHWVVNIRKPVCAGLSWQLHTPCGHFQ